MAADDAGLVDPRAYLRLATPSAGGRDKNGTAIPSLVLLQDVGAIFMKGLVNYSE